MADNAQRYVAPTIAGGLDTKTPQTSLDPSMSPDLQNVLMHRHTVEKRPGFTPLIREHARLNSISNAGHHGNAAAVVGNRDYLIVPGHMLAGHRKIYDTLTALTIECDVQVGDLTVEHGGNAVSGVPPGFGPAPFDLKVRPILTKGPLHRTDDIATAHSVTEANITWKTADTQEWGDGTNEGLPFAIYLFNNGTVATPDWQFRLSFHTFNVTWMLVTVSNTTAIELGGNYHLIATIDNATTTARLRVGRRRDREATAYTTASASFSGETYTVGNRCPIQVFDTPQKFIEATNTGTATQRPGLNLGAPADGGYWFAAKRFEGNIEDIAVYNSDKLSGSLTALDRETKLDVAAATGLVNAWTMTEPGENLVKEMTGRGNHLYFAPSGPVFDGISGSPRNASSWWFNGNTSYADVDLEEGRTDFAANWREFTTGGSLVNAFMQGIVLQNKDHGLEVSFWVDSIEPQMEQVIMEIHAVMRLSIGTDGKFVGYCREGAIVVGTPQKGSLYQGPITSNVTAVPGERYTVSLMRLSGGLSMNMSVNNGDDVTLAGLDASASDGAPISGITFGMGGVETTVEEPTDEGTPNQINTDSRAGFCGRIEMARIICSNRRLTPVYKDPEEDDLQYQQAILWQSPPLVNRKIINPADTNDNVAIVNDGIAAQIGKDFQGRFLRYFVDDASAANQYILDQDVATLGEGGHLQENRVKIRTFFVLAQWHFNFDDKLVNYSGAYVEGLEYRMITSGDLEPNAGRGVHLQQSAVTDDTAALGSVRKKCIESDIFKENYNSGTIGPDTKPGSHRLRPYSFRSPVELAVQWSRGLLTPLTETNHLTMLADWQHQESGERFLMTAAGRQIYWAKPIWKVGTPFDEIGVSSLWFGGQSGDHVVAQASHTEQETTGTGSRTTVVVEAWVYPYRLDGTRLLVMKGDPALQRVNYAVATVDGAIELTGTADGNTKAWRFREGTYRDDEILRSQAIKAQTWNHVHVTFKGTGPEVRVNGDLIPLVDSSSDSSPATADAFTLGTADAANYPLYIGGLPEGRRSVTYNATAAAFTETYDATHARVTEFRQRNAEDTASWPAGESGLPPMVRYVDEANTFYLFPFNEGEGWGFANGAAAGSPDDAHSEIRELVTLKEGLSESRGRRYDFVVFRDRLYVTNGESRPQQILFTRFTDPEGPFRVLQVGMLAPFAVGVVSTEITTGQGTKMSNGQYLISMAFINQDQTTSEFLQLMDKTISAGGANGEGFLINNVPRSHDPQVKGRIFFVSAPGGGSPLINTTLLDNESADLEFQPSASLGLGIPEQGDRLVAPRARQITVGQFSLVLADLPDEPAGQNAFIVSQASEPAYFNFDNTVVIDSADGKPVIAVRGLHGRTYFSKRDSIWQFTLAGISILDEIGVGLRQVNQSIGVGGGDALYDNLIFGAGDKGVHRFDSVNVAYASEELEGDWNTVVDRSDVGLIEMFGSYYWPNSQYWLSVRAKDQVYHDRIYVLHTAIHDRQAWSRLVVPKHTYMASRLRGDNQDPELLIGGLSGQILKLNDVGAGVFIDGSDGGINQDGATTLEGTATSGATTTLTDTAANFDTTGPGLRGVTVKLTTGSTVEERVIESNTKTTLTWRATATAVTSSTVYVIGGYLGYWTSSWAAPQAYGTGLHVEQIDLEVLPDVGVTLTVDNQVAIGARPVDRVWDTTQPTETNAVLLTKGWLSHPLRGDRQNRGRYFRARFSTDGIRTPFQIVGWGFRFKPMGQRGVQD